MAAEPLVILDGDNLAHARGYAGDYAAARERLVGDVAGYMARLGVEAVIVLDGAGRPRQLGRTLVVHSKSESADTVIERLAYDYAEAREVTVVSSDVVLRHVAQRGSVQAMSAREFLDRLAAAPADDPSAPAALHRYTLEGSVDPDVREALERLRRGSNGI